MAQSRRDFLKRAACGAVGLSVMEPLLVGATRVPPWPRPGTRPSWWSTSSEGDDGLNTVIPLTEYTRYRQMRPHLGHPRRASSPCRASPTSASTRA